MITTNLDVTTNNNNIHLEAASEILVAVHVLAGVCEKIIMARDSEDCPKWCASDFYLGGVLQAISTLSSRTLRVTETIDPVPFKPHYNP
jgi:hypothetical protein